MTNEERAALGELLETLMTKTIGQFSGEITDAVEALSARVARLERAANVVAESVEALDRTVERVRRTVGVTRRDTDEQIERLDERIEALERKLAARQ